MNCALKVIFSSLAHTKFVPSIDYLFMIQLNLNCKLIKLYLIQFVSFNFDSKTMNLAIQNETKMKKKKLNRIWAICLCRDMNCTEI